MPTWEGPATAGRSEEEAGRQSSSVESPGSGLASQSSSKSLPETAAARTATAVVRDTCLCCAIAPCHPGAWRFEFMLPLRAFPMRLAAPLQPKRLRHGEQ